MKKLLFTLSITLFSLVSFAQNFTLDTYHAQLRFNVKHMTISNVSGVFKKFDINLTSSKPDFSDANFTVTAETNSINTGIEARDNHLKGDDFFNTEKYPELKFVTNSISKIKANQYKLTGNLTLNGITKPINLTLVYNGTVTDPKSKKSSYGFTILGEFKRSDFKFGEKFPGIIISDEVKINSDLEFTKN